MRLKNITATPHPFGNRIDLRWENPDPVQYPGILVVRQQGTYPVSSEDGVVVVEGIVSHEDTIPTFEVIRGDGINYTENEKGEGIYYLVDKGNLKAETVYYYSLYPYKEGSSPELQTDPQNRITAIATGVYNMAGQMYGLLPGIYHRYDTVLPKYPHEETERIAEEHPYPTEEMVEEDKGRGQLRRFLDLPGVQLDQLYSLAKAMLDFLDIDKVDGRLLTYLAQWIGWPLDYRKEIAEQRNEIRNAPHIYKRIGIIPTLEATIKRLIGWENRTKEFMHNVFLSNCPERLNLWMRQKGSNGNWSEPTEPLSLDFAYEGRPAFTRDGSGTLWLFYHSLRKNRWNIRYKTFREDQGWSPSKYLINRKGTDKYPTSVIQGETLWVFWASYDDKENLWCINYCTCTGNEWSGIETFMDKGNERKWPCAVADNAGHIWLFWLERDGANSRWQVKYNRYNGTDWELASPAYFPLDGLEDPRVEMDPFVLFNHTNQSLWVFWTRRRNPKDRPGEARLIIAYRIKGGIDPDSNDWSEIYELPDDNKDYYDREPACIVNGHGNIELFWSSNRSGNWSVWTNTFDISTGNWGIPMQVTNAPYSQRDPLPFPVDDSIFLIYHSNESLLYKSTVYRATETMDFRYAGCTTIETKNAAKNTLRGKYEDFQAYTYNAGQNGEGTEQDWYARENVGIYLTPDSEDPKHVFRNRKLIENVLKQFLPIQVRSVFIIEQPVYRELIYTYDFQDVRPERRINESFFDSSLLTRISETYSGLAGSYTDTIPDWIWLRSWSEEYREHRTVDFETTPVDTRYRTWHIDLESGG